MIDNIDPVPFLVALAVIVAIWLIVGIRARRRAKRRLWEVECMECGLQWTGIPSAESATSIAFEHGGCVVRPGAYICGDIWHVGTVDTGVDWFLCTRPYEHTGPCLDAVKGVIRR